MNMSRGTRLSHYEIRSHLCTGGMGEVYLAYDTQLERTVAIKILPVSADTQQRLRRFLQEAKAAATIRHPNVAHVYEIGAEGGTHFIVMEYVEGQVLKDKINRRPMGVGQILDFVSQIVDVLAEAHSKGIIHRDIKPANIIITPRGQVKVLDFGLAKIISARSADSNGDDSTKLMTQIGTLMGTLRYMSPEQALSQVIDYRTDIFSLGVLLYEMVTGRLPFTGRTTGEVIDAIIHKQPEAVARFNSDVPAELQRIICKCLEKKPERRYQSARELLIDLDRLRRGSDSDVEVTVAHEDRICSLAVLPFDNLSCDLAQDYFADGLTEALITSLAKISTLRVISRHSAMQYKRTHRSLSVVGRELGVDAVVEGSVQRVSERVLVTVHLIHAATQKHLWVESYERNISDVFKLQSEVASAVVDEMKVKLTPHEETLLANVQAVNSQAYDYFLRGRFYAARQNAESNEIAIEMLQQAISFDKNFAAAYTELARAYNTKAFFFKPEQKEWGERAFLAVEKALSLNPDLAEAHLARGLMLWRPSNGFPHESTIMEYNRALALKPNLDEAHYELGFVYYHLGLLEQAHSELQKAVAINPCNILARFRIGTNFVYMGRYEQALHIFNSSPREINPVSLSYHKAQALFHLGRRDEAQAITDEFLNSYHYDEGGMVMSIQALLFADMGEERKAEETIAAAMSKGKDFGHFHHTAYTIACAYALMNRTDPALHWLNVAADNGFPCHPLFEHDFSLDSLRTDGRFVERMAELKEQCERYRTMVHGN